MDLFHNTLNPLLQDHGVGGIAIFVIAAALASFTIWTAAQWYRLSHVPGPLIASLTSLWAFRASLGGQYHTIVQELQEKYGKVVRIAPNDVLISDPDTLWKINSARSLWTRGGWYASMRFNPYGDSVLSEIDMAAHDKRKAKLISGFSGKGLMDIESSLDLQLSILVDVLKRKVSQGNGQAVIDIGRVLQNFQVDLITLTGTGKAWGNLPTDKDHFNYLEDGDKSFQFIQSTAMVPPLRHLLFSPLFLRLFGSKPTTGWLGSAIPLLLFLKSAVERHTEDNNDEKPSDTMLAEWLKHKISPLEAELDLSIQLPAGTETSIGTIRGLLLYLMTTPRVYYKVKKEIAEGIQNGRISSPVTNDEAKNLPYLQAVISEGMRVASPIVAGFPKKVPPGGEVICGQMLPAGTDVHANYVSMMRDRDIFGDDIEIFRPERFIDADEATIVRRRKVIDLNFGYGRWLCLGRILAILEINKIFVELLRAFDFQVANPEKPWRRESATTTYIQAFIARVTNDPVG
ncbi:hypothetical protein PFICI_11742 [Pestalotiopsis fici W106-1]|uniref:Uncharacterized protein n=1 Tax=Pestalotiopsis fici (strain W106-1 / CGMCC3.15140) TaxID=1229662 RepID=W3WR62_PESFW|nr:uncharacterized protein PFICI_11742 [Pestalotiopsis fici W106-1]ETS76355.1 hypothetical protein PFICI_11742 [Pestalotiopsis fici W106-1]